MNRPPLSSIVASGIAIVCAPALIMFGLDGMPSLVAIKATHTADILGVWVMTWGLIWIGVVAAVGVAWLAWSSQAETLRLEAQGNLREANDAKDATQRREFEAAAVAAGYQK
jgi:hypothetical protein